MDLDTLYALVTDAIRRAEALEELHAPGTRAAYMDVSLLEERIASLLPVTDQEGAIARRGAVSAAIAAHELERAKALNARYLAEDGTGGSLKANLLKLAAEQEAAVAVQHERLAVPVAGHNYSIIALFREKNRNKKIEAQAFSSINELRLALRASDKVESVRVEVYVEGRNADELRDALDEAFLVTPRKTVA